MKRRDHDSREAAIRELMKHDYSPLHRRDGVLVFSDGKRRAAIQREQRQRSTVYHLVDPPADPPIQESLL